MLETITSEHELTELLDTQKRQGLDTWNRPREEAELIGFVQARLARLDEVL